MVHLACAKETRKSKKSIRLCRIPTNAWAPYFYCQGSHGTYEGFENSFSEICLAQRLGFILDQVADVKLTRKLHAWVKSLNPSLILLQPGKSIARPQKNKKWSISINEIMESDL